MYSLSQNTVLISQRQQPLSSYYTYMKKKLTCNILYTHSYLFHFTQQLAQYRQQSQWRTKNIFFARHWLKRITYQSFKEKELYICTQRHLYKFKT